MADKFVPPESAAQAADMLKAAASQTVDQARKAFDDAFGAAQSTMGKLDSQTEQVQGAVRDLARDTVDFASQSAEAAFGLIDGLSKARSAEEVLKLQKAFIEAQMERLGRQTRTLGDQAIRAMQDFTKPFER